MSDMDSNLAFTTSASGSKYQVVLVTYSESQPDWQPLRES